MTGILIPGGNVDTETDPRGDDVKKLERGKPSAHKEPPGGTVILDFESLEPWDNPFLLLEAHAPK